LIKYGILIYADANRCNNGDARWWIFFVHFIWTTRHFFIPHFVRDFDRHFLPPIIVYDLWPRARDKMDSTFDSHFLEILWHEIGIMGFPLIYFTNRRAEQIERCSSQSWKMAYIMDIWPFLTTNPSFEKKKLNVSQNSNFGPRIQIQDKNPNSGQKFKFWTNNPNSEQKSKFWTTNNNIKNINQKFKFWLQNLNFWP